MQMIPADRHLKIGGLIFPNMDQCDFTGPFEALSRIPNSTFHTLWKNKEIVRDMRGMQLVADTSFDEAPQLDVLLVPGGYGQEEAAADEAVLAFIRQQAEHALYVYSVCTGALLCGAAGLLHGRRATTHWTAMDVLPLYGAMPSDERVVIDGNYVSAGGVTSGIDGSLVLASLLRGERLAKELQLYMAYDPQPPFDAGSPATAPSDILSTVRARAAQITEQRLASARQYAERALDRA
ncbi:DJ-1/PfpI family protein [Cupriavidus consociatus]|uniref:DJ-1/PfpI family protein n=1 Tax=Cupriavidus consociatus TaxID=2821357 RepID=UPI001AE6C066|nr:MULTISPECIES: DJ-1/PfpI family protein [unclassified Cupriavidus]MBP0623108.1 DJ-1/PfpI family protein [Cupriavidus sp. LEh25]MDK2659799.1 DJ-1/PfpI family protein [Cupriavidus sp. LEh21]